VLERLSDEGTYAVVSGWLGADLGAYDPNEPIGEIKTNAQQGMIKALIEAAPDKTWRFGDLIKTIATNWIVGTGEQIADELQRWQAEADIDGINLTYTTTPGSFVDFIDGVVPILQQRGVVQTEYTPGTLRETLTGAGPRLNERHPAAAYRRSPNGEVRRLIPT
jgi:alkanesulfonate monooxygenase SsuD/methylene tetrahydromethanopterin reductase-like flavin-dependent oxidoreductase (luciferase family)